MGRPINLQQEAGMVVVMVLAQIVVILQLLSNVKLPVALSHISIYEANRLWHSLRFTDIEGQLSYNEKDCHHNNDEF